MGSHWAKVAADEIEVYIGLHNRSDHTKLAMNSHSEFIPEIIRTHYRSDSRPESGWQLKKVAKITIHPNFNPKTENSDIAILALATPIRVGLFVNAVCLTESVPNLNSLCYATGYGADDERGKMEHRGFIWQWICQWKFFLRVLCFTSAKLPIAGQKNLFGGIF